MHESSWAVVFFRQLVIPISHYWRNDALHLEMCKAKGQIKPRAYTTIAMNRFSVSLLKNVLADQAARKKIHIPSVEIKPM